MLSLSDTVNRFLVVCEDMYDRRVTDSGCCHSTSVKWALSLYLQRLQLLVRSGQLTREKYEALVKIHEKDNIALRTPHVERWNKFLDSLDAAPDFPLTLRGDDVKYHEMEAVSMCDILYLKIVIKVLRQNISNLG